MKIEYKYDPFSDKVTLKHWQLKPHSQQSCKSFTMSIHQGKNRFHYSICKVLVRGIQNVFGILTSCLWHFLWHSSSVNYGDILVQRGGSGQLGGKALIVWDNRVIILQY